jgi:hypothetical protein
MRLAWNAMPYRPLKGRSQVTLEADLVSAQNDLVKGRQRTAIGTPNTNVTFQTEQAIHQRIRDILFELNQLDPDTYTDGDTIPPSMCVAQYTALGNQVS